MLQIPPCDESFSRTRSLFLRNGELRDIRERLLEEHGVHSMLARMLHGDEGSELMRVEM